MKYKCVLISFVIEKDKCFSLCSQVKILEMIFVLFCFQGLTELSKLQNLNLAGNKIEKIGLYKQYMRNLKPCYTHIAPNKPVYSMQHASIVPLYSLYLILWYYIVEWEGCEFGHVCAFMLWNLPHSVVGFSGTFYTVVLLPNMSPYQKQTC